MSSYQRNSVMAEGQTDRKTEDRQSLHGTLHLWGSNKKYIKKQLWDDFCVMWSLQIG